MSISQDRPEDAATRILSYLRSLRDDRGAMADLRCALNPARRSRAWPLLARVGGIGNVRIETVAGLFAYHPEPTERGNLGTTCRHLAAENSTFDGRFRRLIGCESRDEVCDRLRPVILAAKAKGIGVNYMQLLIDLWYWPGKTKERWAQEYWGAPENEEPAAVSASEAAL